MRIARIARTATITTYVAEFNRDDFVVGLFVMMLYFVLGRRRLATAELLSHSTRSPAWALLLLRPADGLLFEQESHPDPQLAIPQNLRLNAILAVEAELGAPGHVALLHRPERLSWSWATPWGGFVGPEKGVVGHGRSAVDAARGPGPGPAGGSPCEPSEGRRTRAASYVLFAFVDAGRAGSGHPGARRASGDRHDAALHAPQPSSDRERDRPSRTPRTRLRWRHVGDGHLTCQKRSEIKGDFGCGGGI